MIRFAILGAGRIGRLHAQTIARHPGAEVVYVQDLNAEFARSVAEQCGATATSDLEAVLAAPAVDAVLIASPTDTHVDLLLRAAKAGKAVLCEKPIDLDLAQVERCRQALEGIDSTIQIGFNRRFDPGHCALRDAIRAGELGNLEQLIITSRDPGLPPLSYLQHSGGIYRDMLIHDFDIARFILDEEIVELCAYGSALVDPAVAEAGDVDSTVVILKTASGRLCHINASRRASYGYDQRIEALGSKGMLLSNNRTHTALERYTEQATGMREPLMNFFLDRYQDAFRLQMDAFVAALTQKQQASPSFDDGYQAQRLAEAAYRSLTTGQSVRLD